MHTGHSKQCISGHSNMHIRSPHQLTIVGLIVPTSLLCRRTRPIRRFCLHDFPAGRNGFEAPKKRCTLVAKVTVGLVFTFTLALRRKGAAIPAKHEQSKPTWNPLS